MTNAFGGVGEKGRAGIAAYNPQREDALAVTSVILGCGLATGEISSRRLRCSGDRLSFSAASAVSNWSRVRGLIIGAGTAGRVSSQARAYVPGSAPTSSAKSSCAWILSRCSARLCVARPSTRRTPVFSSLVTLDLELDVADEQVVERLLANQTHQVRLAAAA